MIRQDWSSLKKLMFMKAAAGGGSAAVERTATGNPLTFVTDLARPLKSLLIPFTPIQQGSGDPSPENVRPILGWNGLNVWNGKNLLDEENVPAANRYIKYVSPTSAQWMSSQDSRSYKWEAEPNTTYTIHAMNPNITVFRVCALENGELSEESTNAFQWDGTGERVCTITTSATEHYLIIQINRSIAIDKKGYVFVAKGTAEENPITETDIVFPPPVYGGTLDVVSGVLTVEWTSYTFNGSEFMSLGSRSESGIRINSNVIDYLKPAYNMAISDIAIKYQTVPTVIESLGYRIGSGASLLAFFVPHSMFDGEATIEKFKEWLASHNMTICTKLDTPQTVTLTPAQITALVGDNTIWSDADGSMTAGYLVSAAYADSHPVGGLSSGLGSGLLGSDPDPDEPIEDPEEVPEEEQPGYTENL